jgi:ABC-type multidrug transport system permease subunit
VAISRRPQQFARRIVTYTFLSDVVLSGVIYLAISHIVGLVVFILGLFVTGLTYTNIRKVFSVRGYR